uniref:Uncharacterized protein n=1 Tax=Heterorhabditis bacteriophora TaxID=37862 RepID=A0A1I7W7M9_HETBA
MTKRRPVHKGYVRAPEQILRAATHMDGSVVLLEHEVLLRKFVDINDNLPRATNFHCNLRTVQSGIGGR